MTTTVARLTCDESTAGRVMAAFEDGDAVCSVFEAEAGRWQVALARAPPPTSHGPATATATARCPRFRRPGWAAACRPTPGRPPRPTLRPARPGRPVRLPSSARPAAPLAVLPAVVQACQVTTCRFLASCARTLRTQVSRGGLTVTTGAETTLECRIEGRENAAKAIVTGYPPAAGSPRPLRGAAAARPPPPTPRARARPPRAPGRKPRSPGPAPRTATCTPGGAGCPGPAAAPATPGPSGPPGPARPRSPAGSG